MSLYPEPTNIWESIEYSTLGITIAESTWMFPTIETVHVIALVTVLGMIAIVDLRLIGVGSRQLRGDQAQPRTRCRGSGARSRSRRSPAACCSSARRAAT